MKIKKAIATASANVIVQTLGKDNLNNKMVMTPDPYALDEVIIYSSGGGDSGSAGYVYYVNSSNGSGYSSNAGSYFNSSHGSGGGGGVSASTSVQIATAIEKQINGDKLDACTKAVLDKLKNLKQADIAGKDISMCFWPVARNFECRISTQCHRYNPYRIGLLRKETGRITYRIT